MSAIVSCLTTCYGRYGARAAIENVRAAGIDCIELPIRTAGVATRLGDTPLVTTEATLADLDTVDRLLNQHGVRVTSCGCFSGNPLHSDVVSIIRRKLDLASHFGAPVVVLDAGSAENEVEREQLYAHLRDIGDHAGKLGITVCFETHRGLCVNHREMLRVMADLDHPHLRLNFDTANLLYYNEYANVEVALAKVCHLVRHLHLKDSMGEYQQWHFPAIGCGGAVDFLRVYQIMRDCGFNGPYSIEIEGIEGEGDLPLEEYHERVVASVTYLRRLGYFE